MRGGFITGAHLLPHAPDRLRALQHHEIDAGLFGDEEKEEEARVGNKEARK